MAAFIIIWSVLLLPNSAQAQTAGSIEPIYPPTSQKVGCQGQSSPMVYCEKWFSFTCIS